MVGGRAGRDRIIGMVLLRPGWEPNYDGRPPVYPIGCAGVVTNAERLPDGRYNIVLQGLEKFRILDEDAGHAYRIARVEAFRRAADRRSRLDADGAPPAGGAPRCRSHRAAAPSRSCRRPWRTRIS